MISLLPGADGVQALSGEKLAAVRFFVPSDFLLTQIPEKKEEERVAAETGVRDAEHRGVGVHEMAI